MQPTILYNPKDTKVEFMYDHQVYIFNPGEKRVLSGDVANYALKFINSGLLEYDGLNEPEGVNSGVAYDKMPWKKVVSLASKKGLFKPGMKKEEVYKALEESDVQGN